MGITRAFFQALGNVEDFIDRLNMKVTSGVKHVKALLTTKLLTLSKPDDLETLISLTSLTTSCSETSPKAQGSSESSSSRSQ